MLTITSDIQWLLLRPPLTRHPHSDPRRNLQSRLRSMLSRHGLSRPRDTIAAKLWS